VPRRKQVPTDLVTNGYQCVLSTSGEWHLTQEQMSPPPPLRGQGCFTSCAKWMQFDRGYERRRPTCPECLQHVTIYETPR
jgi:allantoicase